MVIRLTCRIDVRMLPVRHVELPPQRRRSRRLQIQEHHRYAAAEMAQDLLVRGGMGHRVGISGLYTVYCIIFDKFLIDIGESRNVLHVNVSYSLGG